MTKLFFCLAIFASLGSCQPDNKKEINSRIATLQLQIGAYKWHLDERAEAIARFSVASDSVKRINKYDSLLVTQKQQILELGLLEESLNALRDSLIGR